MSLVGVTYEQIKLIEKIVQSGFPLERLVSIYKEIEPFPDQVKTIIRIIETGLSLEKITSLYREIQNFEKEKSTENGTVTVKSDRGHTLHEENGQLSMISLENTSTPDCDPSSSSSVCQTSSLNNCKYQTNGTIYSPPAAYEASITPPSSINLEHSMEPIEKRETSSNRSYLSHLSQSSHNTSHSSLFQASAYPDDESFELQAFKAKGEEEMLTEMKAFIHKYHITQNIIANWCGLSQGYISRFFKDREQMSETVKDKIYQWYLEFRKNPSKNIGEKLIFSENGDVRPIRRDRFIFKRVHLDILEPAFDENQYPENDVKEELAEKCNVAFERIKKRHLKENEKVTVNILNNWFNNKRKEHKVKNQIKTRGTRDRQDRNSDANWQYLESSPLRLETHPDIDNLPNFEYYESGNEESQASYPASLDQTSLNLHIKMEPRE